MESRDDTTSKSRSRHGLLLLLRLRRLIEIEIERLMKVRRRRVWRFLNHFETAEAADGEFASSNSDTRSGHTVADGVCARHSCLSIVPNTPDTAFFPFSF